MSAGIDAIADAVLFEGHLLYPYRRDALKNAEPWGFGTLYPEARCEAHGGDRSWLQLECLVEPDAGASVSLRLRFLQREGGRSVARAVESGPLPLSALSAGAVRTPFAFPPVEGAIDARAEPADGGAARLVVRVSNLAQAPGAGAGASGEAAAWAMLSPHLIVTATSGALVSLIDPPERLRAAAAACRNTGTWPVLVGPPGSRRALLAAPIILYDYPEVAPESPGDCFDGTEIDEILALRILTLTDDEKRAMRACDERAAALLDRTLSLSPAQLGALHGALRRRAWLAPGARVRLRPRGRADVFDLALAGKAATVEAVERDLEGRTHVAVSIDDDPGRDMGPFAHRFFFGPDEVEPL